MKMRDVFEDVVRHLSEDVKFTEWNIGTAAVKYSLKKYNCDIQHPQPIEGASVEDGIFIDVLMQVFFSYEFAFEELNWSTKEIGTWMAKNFYQFVTSCPYVDVSEFQEKFDSFFTKDGDYVSILDIGHLFSIMDVEALVANSVQGHIYQHYLDIDYTDAA